jgi:tetratricopeptide (TPR) repeat protein
MTKRTRINNNNKKKSRRKDAVKIKKAPKQQVSLEEWLQTAATCMTTLDIEAAYHAYQEAESLLLSMQHQEPTSVTSSLSLSSSLLDQLVNVSEKMGEIQVSMGDPDQARQHFAKALQLIEQKIQQQQQQRQQQSSINWSIWETHASLCLYIGQLSIEQQALESYLKGVSSLEKCIRLVETDTDVVIPSSAHTDTDTAMNTDDAISKSSQQRQETIQQLQQKLSSAYSNMADLYLTDLCDEETAENDCQQYLEMALQLKDVDGEPMVDALQGMANLRLSQDENRRYEAVSYILRAYEKQRVGSEALAALVGLNDGGKQRKTDSSSNRSSDVTVLQEDLEEEYAKELVEVDAANNLPEFEFRCQTAKILLECANLLSKQGKDQQHDVDTTVVSTEETQCIDAAISVLGSLLAQNDEVVEIWYLTGCAFAAKTPPLPDAALYYLERAQEMLTDIRTTLAQELRFADNSEMSDLEHELELNSEQMKDVVSKCEEMKVFAHLEQNTAMQED